MTSLLTLTSYWLQSLTLFFGHPALSSGHPAYLSYAAGPSALDVHFVSTPRIVAGDHVTILGQHAGSIVSVTRSGATYVARLQLNPLLSSTVTSGTVALVTETASPLIENSTEKDGVELVLPHQAQAPLKDESSIPGFNQHIEYWLHAEQGGVV